MAEKDYYKLLGIEKSATADEIKSAYRRMAKKYHPDTLSTASDAEKKAAEAKFKDVNHAYEVLSDSQKREIYDQYGDETPPNMGGFGGFGQGFSGGGSAFEFDDILSSIFSGFGGAGGFTRTGSQNVAQRGQDLLVGLSISFEEAAFGVEKTVSVRRVENCPTCKGTGAKNGTSFKTCSACNGSGKVQSVQRTPFGQFSSVVPCPTCKGRGKIIEEVCPTCEGKPRREYVRDIKINIPAGIDNDQRINYAGEGGAGINNGENGNLIIQIKIRPHKLFTRGGNDLFVEIPITILDAALGCEISVPTLTTPAVLSIPAGTQTGTEFKIKGQGIKFIRKTTYGDLYVKVLVEVPKTISKEQKDLLKKLQTTIEIKQFPKQKEYK
ncbi:MAG TPA: molecular chaperone DnaJ, partial [Clostridia bacterium]|nr:molecular chaperone DnaJ [Clostridia bacterium]